MLEAKNLLKVYSYQDPKNLFKTRKVVAVADVSLNVTEKKTLGIVGGSGCGKSTLARLLTLLEKPDEGQIIYKGKNTAKFRTKDLRDFRRDVQIIFQDPLGSLNPRMKIFNILKEPFEIHAGYCKKKDIPKAIEELLEKVGLVSEMQRRYPHELSGGERQRVCIARALALKPRIVICDEAVSSLDVLIQAQILNLLLKLQQDKGLAYVFISHDIDIVRHMSDYLVVMHDGSIIEEGQTEQVFSNQHQAYTRTLLRNRL